jgi:hypothetical protein
VKVYGFGCMVGVIRAVRGVQVWAFVVMYPFTSSVTLSQQSRLWVG